VLNDLYREADRFGIKIDGARVSAAGGGHRLLSSELTIKRRRWPLQRLSYRLG